MKVQYRPYIRSLKEGHNSTGGVILAPKIEQMVQCIHPYFCEFGGPQIRMDKEHLLSMPQRLSPISTPDHQQAVV
jgi:hypothetical protein